MDTLKFETPSILKKYLWVIIAIGFVVTLISYFHTPARFWVNLVINNFYFTGMALSGLFFLALQNLTKSSWMRPYQRVPEAMMGYLPYAFVFVLIGLLGSHTLYEWTHTELVKNDPILIKKVDYLNLPFFVTRIIIYFTIWISFSYLVKKIMNKFTKLNAIKVVDELSVVSAISMVFFALTFSFFSYDLLMSIEPHWFSTIYSVYTFSGMFVGGIAFITLSLIVLKQLGYLKEYIKIDHFHDLGKWMFGMSTFWAYIWFCQYMLIWYANIPEETQYFILRDQGNWQWLFWTSFAFSFLIPFFGLLTRNSKRSLLNLAIISCFILVSRWVDLYTLVAPKIYEHHKVEAIIGPYEIISAVMFAAIFVLVFLYYLSRKSLIVEHDPYLEEGSNLEQ